MTRILYATLVGICGAAVVHLAIVLLLPALSENAPCRLIEANTSQDQPFVIPAASSDQAARTELNGLDPFFANVICRFDLQDGALHIVSTGNVPVWTVSVHDVQGRSFFSANDRIAAGGRIDLLIANPGQVRTVRQNAPEAHADSVIAPAPDDSGFAVVRVFVPDETWRPATDSFIDTLRCRSVSF